MRSCGKSDRKCCGLRWLGIAVLAVVGIGVLGLVVMLLWNWLIPTMFLGARTIDYCQALGILLLSKILFGGGFHGKCQSHFGRRRQAWDSMTPEEREQLRNRAGAWWNRCCTAPEQAPAAPGEGEARRD